MTHPKLAFIGAGNMARSIIGGLIAEGYPAQAISASDLKEDTLKAMAADFGIGTGASDALAMSADVVILAVKPQGLKAVAQSLQPALSHRPLIISIAAGITAGSLAQWLGQDQAIVRCMPNTPSLVKAGASGLYANAHTDSAQKAIAEQVMSAVGLVEWFDDEAQLDAVTAVSGSGPAYYFLVMEAMIEAAESLGLPKDSATRLTLQTALGAAELAKASDVEVAELRRRVMSPGGTTERAIQSFEQDQLRAVFARAMTRCAERSTELAKELGDH